MTIRTTDGDVLDEVCWRHYGREEAVPAVLAANPGLTAAHAVLPGWRRGCAAGPAAAAGAGGREAVLGGAVNPSSA